MIEERKVPLCVGIIPDGNRRWAKANGMHPWQGHEKAIENFRKVAEFCRDDRRIAVLTVWCFSTENWKRDPMEVATLMQLLEKYLSNEREAWQREKTRFVHSGRKDRIPKSLAKLLNEVERESRDRTECTIHLAIDYGGKDEVVRAWQRAQKANEPNEPNEATIARHLDHPELPDIDIVIRTSGEIRTSNFFLWQAAYAEWIFLEKHFPDFGIDDVKAALAEFDQRQRRFGT